MAAAFAKPMPDKPIYLQALYDERRDLEQRLSAINDAIDRLEASGVRTEIMLLPKRKLRDNIIPILKQRGGSMALTELYNSLRGAGIKMGTSSEPSAQVKALRIAIGSNIKNGRLKFDEETELVSLPEKKHRK